MIRFENVTKRYRGTTKPALNDVDFEVQRGEFVFLVGASGSGKSSCLRLILREDGPSEGRVVVLGRDLRTLSNRKVPYFRRHIGSVFQDFRLLPNKTVFQNVAFTLQVIGSSRAFIQQAVPEVLALVGLEGKQKRLPHELSGGEQQRVAIARALVNRPQILLADEPTGNLDPATSVDIMQLLARINAGGTTVVMATHEAGFVDQMQRRVIELRGGVMVRDERHGGYGDISDIPTLQPAQEKGAAAVAALTAVLELQREIIGTAGGEATPFTGTTDRARAAARGDVAASAQPAAAAAAGVTPVTPATSTTPVTPTVPAGDQTPTQTSDRRVRQPRATEAREATQESAPTASVALATPAETAAASADSPASDAGAAPVEPPTRTNPVTIELPPVELDELGLADRLGLGGRTADDEVGPTS
ncbi:cell division ATP-binding protein FtsE [Microbacterium sp. zg.Y1090]|uniref:cell division ATP-binding protein FtsE n=1 Tax=Microbacterium TaxID=33882 RepID=UPI00214C65B4|nr:MULTISPECIES: cell division ATP-binding protein FtsE [unclassified Microbacterium]MCR2811529.1 cell division ATP-binding protein FtsE [Microbacterium sp. zg.Y1084]MCR2819049.1 cell division ATP-binding protein FtsE [Microbacterium sp. zg.Y1090]MDL5487699.1 cell division ATP-binding protein FtsE [Microbacterium sp. zg-Y1211]WIM27353.1 cell division ATP-binding protein FtsE [Microbacterium sp. zg-Y1090]